MSSRGTTFTLHPNEFLLKRFISGTEAEKLALQMFGHKLITNQTRPEGLPVNQLYVAEQLDVAGEYYLAITVSRELYAPMLLVSKGGGTGVEQLAAQRPDGVLSIPLRYSQGITDNVVNAVCEKLALEQGKYEEVKNLLTNLYCTFQQSDATLLEINPLVESGKNRQLICADTKLTIDNAARHRQAELFDLRDVSQENPIELEAEKHGLVYVQLDGTIGCLVNGAGLAMATNDAVSHFGGQCANFLDGGGQATASTMKHAFELILRDKKVNTILVNIYGGQQCTNHAMFSILISNCRYHSLRYDRRGRHSSRQTNSRHTGCGAPTRYKCRERPEDGTFGVSRIVTVYNSSIRLQIPVSNSLRSLNSTAPLKGLSSSHVERTCNRHTPLLVQTLLANTKLEDHLLPRLCMRVGTPTLRIRCRYPNSRGERLQALHLEEGPTKTQYQICLSIIIPA